MSVILAAESHMGGQQKIMNIKLVAIMVIVMVAIACCDGEAALRRKPKVYNALITTDEDLVQSRAYPVIQPTIHESGVAQYPYGPYNPFGVYNQHVLRLGQPIVPALKPKDQLTYPLPPVQISPELIQQPLLPQPSSGYPLPQSPPTAIAEEKPQPTSLPPTGLEEQPQPTIQPPTIKMQTVPTELTKDPNQPNKMPSEQLPISLNQYGLPPSLIPLSKPQPYQPSPYLNGLHPFHLPPYRFNQIPPFYYNSLPGLQQQQFLPPYGYLPTGPQFPLSNTIPTDNTYPHPPSQALPTSTATPSTLSTLSTSSTSPPTPPVTTVKELSESSAPPLDPVMPEVAFENIKNGSKSKDTNVPDVPPPPIPSGAKSKQF